MAELADARDSKSRFLREVWVRFPPSAPNTKIVSIILLSTQVKKIISSIIVIVLAVLFWSPWMGLEGGEDIIRKVQEDENFQAELDELSEHAYDVSTGEGCDGLSSKWAPFGRQVEYCEFGSWYVSFWGR